MPEYLWTGKDKFGNPFVLRIDAPNAAAAQANLVERGSTDLQLHTGDVSSAVKGQLDYKVQISAEQELAYRRKGGFKLREIWMRTLSGSWGTILLLALTLALTVYRQQWLMSFVLVGFILGFPAINLWYSQSSYYFSQLNKARAWHQWNDVLDYVEKLRRARFRTKTGLNDALLVRYRALALAGRGRLEDAIKEFSSLATDPNVPRWLYICQLAGVYDIVQNHEEALNLRQQAAALKPDDPVILIDLAYQLARYQKDTKRAKELLDRVEQGIVVELAKPHVALCRGIIALEEHDPVGARQKLLESLAAFRPFLKHDLIETSVFITKAFLGCAEATLGNSAEAQRLFVETRPFLMATNQADLIVRCERVIATS